VRFYVKVYPAFSLGVKILSGREYPQFFIDIALKLHAWVIPFMQLMPSPLSGVSLNRISMGHIEWQVLHWVQFSSLNFI